MVWPRTSPAGAVGCGEPQHQAAWLSAERLRGRGRHGPRLPLGQVLCRPTGPALSQPEQGRVKRRDHLGARHAGGLIPGPFRSGEQRRVGCGQDPAGPASRDPTAPEHTSQEEVPDTPPASARRPERVGALEQTPPPVWAPERRTPPVPPSTPHADASPPCPGSGCTPALVSVTDVSAAPLFVPVTTLCPRSSGPHSASLAHGTGPSEQRGPDGCWPDRA